MDDTFKRRVVERSMRAACAAIEQMNLDMIEGTVGLVPFGMMMRATQVAREIQREIAALPPVEKDEQETECNAASIPPINDEDWGDYNDFHSS
jgi:hypothetical protein